MTQCACGGILPDCPLCQGTGVPVCDMCNGTGHLLKQSYVDEHMYTAVECPSPDCIRQPAKRAVIGLRDGAEDYTFANLFDGFPALDNAAVRIRQAVDRRKGWIVFFGPSGIGKTYLMTAGANYAAGAGLSVYYGHTSTIMDELHAAVMGQHKHGMTYSALKRLLVECDLLCLDEFGDFNVTDWKRDRVKEILEYRANPVWAPTMIATNKSGREIEKVFPWLGDRLNQRNMVYETALPGVPSFRGRI